MLTLAVLVSAGLAIRLVPAELESTPQNLRDEEGDSAEIIGVTRGRPAVERAMQIQWLLGWMPVLERFLRWNATRYTDLTGDGHTFLRTDLFEKAR